MVGRKERIVPMWAKLRNKLDVEHPTPLIDQVYAECTQRAAAVDDDAVRAKTGIFHRITKVKLGTGIS